MMTIELRTNDYIYLYIIIGLIFILLLERTDIVDVNSVSEIAFILVVWPIIIGFMIIIGGVVIINKISIIVVQRIEGLYK